MLVLDWRAQAALPDIICVLEAVCEGVGLDETSTTYLYASTSAVHPGVGLPCLCWAFGLGLPRISLCDTCPLSSTAAVTRLVSLSDVQASLVPRSASSSHNLTCDLLGQLGSSPHGAHHVKVPTTGSRNSWHPFFVSPKNTLWSPNTEKSKSQNQPIKWKKKKTPNQPTSDICSCHSKFFCFALQILNVILCQYWNGTAWEMQGEIKENNLSFLKCVTRL